MIQNIREYLYTLYKKIEIQQHRLYYVFLEITRRCNLQCRHCGSDCTSEKSPVELSTGEWISFIDKCCIHFGHDVSFVITGGEPLLHRDIEVIAQTIHNHGNRWGMVTNGYALCRTTLEKLVSCGLYSITISLDGLEEQHNYLRNKSDAYRKALDSLQLVVQSSIPIIDVVTCVYPGNIEILSSIADILLQIGIPAWRLFRIFPSGRAYRDSSLHLSHSQTQQMYDWIAREKKRMLRKNLRINASCEGWLPFSLDRKVRDQPFFCRAGINIAGILNDGTITGCTNNSNAFHIGNIRHDNFIDCWEHGFDDFRNRSWVNQTSCKSCSYVKKCQGGSIHLWESKVQKPMFCFMNSTGHIRHLKDI